MSFATTSLVEDGACDSCETSPTPPASSWWTKHFPGIEGESPFFCCRVSLRDRTSIEGKGKPTCCTCIGTGWFSRELVKELARPGGKEEECGKIGYGVPFTATVSLAIRLFESQRYLPPCSTNSLLHAVGVLVGTFIWIVDESSSCFRSNESPFSCIT